MTPRRQVHPPGQGPSFGQFGRCLQVGHLVGHGGLAHRRRQRVRMALHRVQAAECISRHAGRAVFSVQKFQAGGGNRSFVEAWGHELREAVRTATLQFDVRHRATDDACVAEQETRAGTQQRDQLAQEARAIAQVKHHVERHRGVDGRATRRQGLVQVGLHELQPRRDAGVAPPGARRLNGGHTQFQPDAMAAGAHDREDQRPTGSAAEVQQSPPGTELEANDVGSQLVCRHPRVLPDVFAVGLLAECFHQRRIELAVQRVVARC